MRLILKIGLAGLAVVALLTLVPALLTANDLLDGSVAAWGGGIGITALCMSLRARIRDRLASPPVHGLRRTALHLVGRGRSAPGIAQEMRIAQDAVRELLRPDPTVRRRGRSGKKFHTPAPSPVLQRPAGLRNW
jgi:hypothetical protein